MAEPIISKQAVVGGIDTATMGILIVTIICLFIALIVLIMWLKKYSKVVVIRKIVNNRVIVSMDKVRYLKDKDGVEWYKFLKLRKIVKIPSSVSIDITSKGKDFLECFLKPTGEISWGQVKADEFLVIEPFTTEDRETLQYQFYKAHLEGGVNWKELIIPIFGIIALVIIVVSLMIFYKDMGEPLLAMADKNIVFVEKMTELVEKIDMVSNCTQIVRPSGSAIPINQNVVIPN